MTPVARLGSVVDRLAVSVHLAMRNRSDEVRARLAATGLRSPVFLIDLRPWLLGGMAPRSLLEEFARFQDPEMLAEVVAGWSDIGAVRADGGDFVAAPAVIDYLDWSTGIYDELLEQGWSPHRAMLEEVAPMLESALGVDTEDGLPLFAALYEVPASRDNPWFRVWHQLVTLRYLRSDRHVARLHALEIPLASAALFDASNQSREVADWLRPWERDLRARGWIAVDGQPTKRGQSARAAVDDQVDSRMMATFDAVSGSFDYLAATLPELPDRLAG